MVGREEVSKLLSFPRLGSVGFRGAEVGEGQRQMRKRDVRWGKAREWCKEELAIRIRRSVSHPLGYFDHEESCSPVTGFLIE